ncbi:MAG: hypothetical protein KGI97_03255 [Alphaproteobacteria bacterium]|nr:hypothetical protein [Alphaproteobacteria bacterium]
MSYKSPKSLLLTVVEKIYTVAYFLIIAGVVYFILGAVTSLVGGQMLHWTFCGAAHSVFGVDWCGYTPHTGWAWGDLFVHRLINAALPWTMIVIGVVGVCVCWPIMNSLGFKLNHRDNRD